MARSRSWARVVVVWRASTSATCRPTVRIGLSATFGFWKIIEISRPRRSARSDSFAPMSGKPSNTARPAVMRAALSERPSSA